MLTAGAFWILGLPDGGVERRDVLEPQLRACWLEHEAEQVCKTALIRRRGACML
jgi:hypothetical protein